MKQQYKDWKQSHPKRRPRFNENRILRGKMIKIDPWGKTWLLAAVKACTTENCHKAEEQTEKKVLDLSENLEMGRG